MKRKLVILVMVMLIILPITVYGYGGINTNVVIGNTSAASSSVVMTNNIVGTLQVLGTIISVAALIIIGIRYMISSVDDKAQLKGVIPYYVAGAVLVFATSNILALAHSVMQDVGHSWEISRVEPTCTQNGSAYHECTDLGCDEQYTTVIPALGHSYGNWTTKTEANCTTPKVEQHKCVRCNKTETRNSGSPLGHSYGDWTTKIEAKCTAAKVEQHKCVRCNKTETRSSGSPLGHSYGNWTQQSPATCTSPKIEEHSCTRCGATETRENGSSLGHSYGSWTQQSPATCTSPKIEKHTCTVCGATETRENGSPSSHSYRVETTPGTCTQKEETKYTCSICGFTYTEYGEKDLGAHNVPTATNSFKSLDNGKHREQRTYECCRLIEIFGAIETCDKAKTTGMLWWKKTYCSKCGYKWE